MTVSLLVEFRNPERAAIDHPFSVQSVVRDRWRPLADALGLPVLADLGGIFITEPAEAEQLLAELTKARGWLETASGELGSDRDYMIARVDQVMPLLAAALADWAAVAEVSL